MRRGAFTLIELVVVILIVGLLIGLAAEAVFASIEASRANTCRSNLHQIGIILNEHDYAKPYDSSKWHFQCPSYDGPFHPDASYASRAPAMARHKVMEQLAPLTSVEIVMVFDARGVHCDRQIALYLDGHVDFIH